MSRCDAFEAVGRANVGLFDGWRGFARASRDRTSALDVIDAELHRNLALESRHLKISCFQPASEGRARARRAKGF